MFTSRLAVGTSVAAALSVLLLVSACGGNDDENKDICRTSVTSGSSPAPGILTLAGNFYANETVILSYNDNGVTKQVTGTPPSDRSSFTFIGLPSGDVSLSITISCDAGRENNGSKLFTVR